MIFSMTMTENYASDNGKNNYDNASNNDDDEMCSYFLEEKYSVWTAL